LPSTAIFEAVFTLQKLYLQPRRAIMDGLLPIIELPGVEVSAKSSLRSVFELYVRFASLSFADAYHAQTALDDEDGQIVSFDRGLSRVPGIKRIEPE